MNDAAGLLEHNAASHLIWWVGGLAFALLVVFVLVDLARDLWWRLRAAWLGAEERPDNGATLGEVRRHFWRPVRTVLRSRWPELPDRRVEERAPTTIAKR